jgi:HK97 family phage major capsid protein
MPADATIRDRLKAVREELGSQRTQRSEAKKERDSAKDKFASASHDGPFTNWPEFKDAEEATRKVGVLDDQIADLRGNESALLSLLGEMVDTNGHDAIGSDGPSIANANAWNGHRLVGPGTEYDKHRQAGTFASSSRFGSIQLGQLADRDHAVQFLTQGPGTYPPDSTLPGPVSTGDVGLLIQPDRQGMAPWYLQPLTLLSLIPTGTTNSNSIEYVQMTGILHGADMVVEGAVKPQVTQPTYADATAPIRTVAGWIKLNRIAVDDAPAVATMINTQLPYDVQRKIEQQVIHGDGTGQNLLGLLNQPGIGAPAFVPGDNPADALLRAMTTVILAGGSPNIGVIHPVLWQDILLMRETGADATRSGQYLAGGPFGSTAQTMWGLSLTPTVAIAEDAPLVGDTRGVTLFVREGISTKMSDSDQDDFVRNRVTLLAEARIGLCVWRPDFFAEAALA